MSAERRPSRRATGAVVVAGALLAFGTGMGARDHGNHDVSRYAQMAFEMRHDRTLVPTIRRRPYHDAMPLAAWATLALAEIQGTVTPLSSRALPALCAVLTVAVTFLLALRLGATTAMLAGIGVTLNALALVHGRMSRIDPALSLGVATGIASAFQACESRRWRWLVVAGLGLALGIAAKGPLALVLYGGPIAAWLAFERRPRQLLAAATIPPALALAITGLWLAPYVRYLGPAESRAFFDQFLLRENLEKFESGYGKSAPFWTYLASAIPAFAPWIVASAAGLLRTVARPKESTALERLAISWIATSFLVFSAASGKQVRYLLPVLPALAVVAGAELDRWLSAGRPRSVVAKTLALAAGAIALAAPLAVVSLVVMDGPRLSAIALGVVALASGVSALAALRRGDLDRGLLATHVGCGAAVGLVFAAVLPLPTIECRSPVVALAQSLRAQLPPEPQPFTVIETRPPSDGSGIDETELGLHLGRWVDRATDGGAVAGVLLAREPIAGRATLATVEWRPSAKETAEAWLLLGAPAPAR